ncbi:MAG: type II secretion system protein [Candidatus Gastranaerophilales bacterium]|nr:type II secretion system protein [Candidatus Gastranaerophilales bacterium]
MRKVNKKAFTLSELLIAVVIIGVISAITISSLIQTTQKKELEAGFKKQYSALKQAIIMLKMNDGLDFTPDNYKSTFMEKLASQYNVIQDCGHINYNQGCILLDDDSSFSYYKSFTNGTLSRSYFDDGGFISADGTLFLIEQGSQAQDKIGNYLVTVDVNGYTKKPGKMGYDLFMFQITTDGDVLPMGANNTYFSNYREDYCSKSTNSSNNGYTCAYYAAVDKDYFTKL